MDIPQELKEVIEDGVTGDVFESLSTSKQVC